MKHTVGKPSLTKKGLRRVSHVFQFERQACWKTFPHEEGIAARTVGARRRRAPTG